MKIPLYCDKYKLFAEEHQEFIYNTNAPPDALGVLDDGQDRGLKTLQDIINHTTNDNIFVCGLAMDFCGMYSSKLCTFPHCTLHVNCSL